MIGEEEKVALLRRHVLLQHLRDWDLKRLAMVARTDTLAAGKPVFEKDAPGGSMFAVIEGRVLIYNRSIEGRDIVFNLIGPGEVFGELSVLDGEPRSASAKTLERTRLLVLERNHLLPFLKETPEVCVELITVLCGRLRQTTNQLEDSAFLELKPRLARKLLQLAEHYGTATAEGHIAIALSLSQGQLGAMLNATRESVNRCFAEWARIDLVSFEQGEIKLCKPRALEAVANGASSGNGLP